MTGGNRTTETEVLPLFYTAPEPVSPQRHGDKGLALSDDLGFAAKAYVIPLMSAEMPAAMRSYPIVFSGPDHMPMAVTGVRAGENLFVDGTGAWAKPHYVPAYVRRYPFILSGGETDERLALCIDNDPERLVSLDDSAGRDVRPLFEDMGQGEVIRNALAFCEQYQAMYVRTRQIMKVIAESGLLAERTGKITLGDGQTFNITGFHLVEEAGLQAMGDEDFLKLRHAEALTTVYCHLASMNSWASILHQAELRSA